LLFLIGEFSSDSIAQSNIWHRHLNQILSPEEIQLAVGSSSDGIPSMELPADDEAHTGMNRPITMRTISGVSAASRPTTRLGPFCRASEAAALLGKVLDLVARSSYTNEMDEAKARELDVSLQGLAMNLMKLAVNGWEECCAAIGLTLRYSSCLVLPTHELTGTVLFFFFMKERGHWSEGRQGMMIEERLLPWR
jgi:hypothetical protein